MAQDEIKNHSTGASHSSRITDSPVAAGHDIHMTMRALPMPVNPDKLFGRAASRTSRHHMDRNAI